VEGTVVRALTGLAALVLAVTLASPAATAETCGNCEDDDGNGLVDCHDPACWSDPVACPGSYLDAPVRPIDCSPTLALSELWRSRGYDGLTPVAGDIDGDGLPEVVYRSHSLLYIVDGVTGAEERTAVALPNWQGQLAIADVDRDGTSEVFGLCASVNGSSIVRLEHDFSVTYGFGDLVAPAPPQQMGVSFADFDHDGAPEAFWRGALFDPADGRLLLSVDGAFLPDAWFTVAADVLPDDQCRLCAGLELVGDRTVWAVDVATGQFEVAARYAASPQPAAFAVVDWNGDARLDVVVASLGGDYSGYGDTSGIGVFAWDPRLETTLAGPVRFGAIQSNSVPSIANFDADPDLEMAILAQVFVPSSPNDPGGTRRVVRLLDHDLSRIRDMAWVENSQWCSLTNFDFDSDGVAEIVGRGSETMTVLSSLGRTIASAPCRSGTSREKPIVADVNADGQADIVAGCFNSVVAWTLEGGAPARSVHNQWHYDVVNVDDDLTIPCRMQDKSAPGLPAFVNNSQQQAPLLAGGIAEECRCAAPPIAAGTATRACGSDVVTLRATGPSACVTARRHRWIDAAGQVACGWSTSDECVVAWGTGESYVLDVDCDEDRACSSRAIVPVVTSPGWWPEPSAVDRVPSSEPVRVTRGTGRDGVRVTWEDVAATGYRVYGGRIDALQPSGPRPEPLACGELVPRADLVLPGPGTWLVVVAGCDANESSYGRDSFGRERVRSLAVCP
jgi:hypothetical protein